MNATFYYYYNHGFRITFSVCGFLRRKQVPIVVYRLIGLSKAFFGGNLISVRPNQSSSTIKSESCWIIMSHNGFGSVKIVTTKFD